MLKEFKDMLNEKSKKSKTILYIMGAIMFIIATIYMVIGIMGFIK